MNPNAGEGNNNQPSVTSVDAVVEPNVGASLNPLSSLEGVVAAAQKVAAADQQTAPAAPDTSPAETPGTPEKEFQNQFGSGTGGTATPPAAEVPTNVPVAPLDPGIIEAVEQPKDPQATFVQEVRNAIKKLEEATKEKASV